MLQHHTKAESPSKRMLMLSLQLNTIHITTKRSQTQNNRRKMRRTHTNSSLCMADVIKFGRRFDTQTLERRGRRLRERDSEAPETGRSCGNPPAVSQKHIDRPSLSFCIPHQPERERREKRAVYSSIMSAQHTLLFICNLPLMLPE